MAVSDVIQAVDDAIARLRKVSWKERDAIREELIGLVQGAERPQAVRDHLEAAQSGLPLELRWELQEVIEATEPAPEPSEEPEEEPEPEDAAPEQLSASDLKLVYDDPRGLLLHKSKKGDRWFATQRDPRTGEPRTFELHAQEIQALKTQLEGSPYWVIGAGEALST